MQIAYHSPFGSDATPKTMPQTIHRVQELKVNKREMHLVEVYTVKIHGLDTN